VVLDLSTLVQGRANIFGGAKIGMTWIKQFGNFIA